MSNVHPVPRKPAGFSLIEALVAMVVVAVGLLGLAAMITAGLRSNQIAALQGLAAIDSENITGLMAANPAGVEAGNYIISALPTSAPGNLCESETAPCSPSEEAQADLWSFAETLQNNLPDPAAQIQCAVPCSSTGNTPIVVTVSWSTVTPNGKTQSQATYSTVYQP